MKSKTAACVENVGESACSCLLTMVHGNVLALTLSHWLIASQTGLLAGIVASAAIVTARLRKPWMVSLTLGVATAGVDFAVHPATFNVLGVSEAVVTGVGASALSFAATGIARGAAAARRRWLAARA
jgi:hypothetical protein